MEKTTAESALHLCSDKLADSIRNIWLENTKQGVVSWEKMLSEDPCALPGLREEGFESLVGLDYIFKWWGGQDSDDLAGEIDVTWKVIGKEEMDNILCYRTWIKVAERDFVLGMYPDERSKREVFRASFHRAFKQWRELFASK